MSASPAILLLGRTLLIATTLFLLAAAAAWIAGSPGAIPSLATGLAIAAASFAILVLVVSKGMSGDTSAIGIGLLGTIKMAAIGLLLWWLIRRGLVTPLAFLAGFSTMVAALVVEGIWNPFRSSRG